MFIVIHCGGMPFNGETIKTKSLGGSESAAYYMAKELAVSGHRVTMFTREQKEGVFDDVKYVWCGEESAQHPLGNRFHFYAANTPHDVCIVQRHPQAFVQRYASKVNLLWLHDLALIRSRKDMQAQMWNITGILAVSEFHKKQVCEIWGLNPDSVHAITNGVDLNLFNPAVIPQYTLPDVTRNDYTPILYSSRPERGLRYLVEEKGIMERMLKRNPKLHLFVCNYANTAPHMRDFYDALYADIDHLPNCTMLGHLTKQELADVMRQCKLLIYPTDFEEVSCITAMEAMAAGLPMLTSEHAALPETCKDAGVTLLPLVDDHPSVNEFCDRLDILFKVDDNNALENMRVAQYAVATKYSWTTACVKLNNVITGIITKLTSNKETVAQHMLRMSDVYALSNYSELNPELKYNINGAYQELSRCYGFAFNNTFKEHYAAYYQYEKDRGVNYGPESLESNTRFESVAGFVRDNTSAGDTILDYGCAHGHYTISLAKRFADRKFVGIDLARSNIDIANKWKEDDKVENAIFYEGSAVEGRLRLVDSSGFTVWNDPLVRFRVVIAAEVVEHVGEPRELVMTLMQYVRADGFMVITVPYGPWEAQGYVQHDPWRAHLWHFERADIHDLFGHLPQLRIQCAPSGHTREGEPLGSHIVSFGMPVQLDGADVVGHIDYDRKFRLTVPERQTLSVCLIVKDAALTLAKCLESVKDIADEIIIAVDETTTDDTIVIAGKYTKGFSAPDKLLFTIKSPLEIGFDAARNLSIANAKGDWILWLDADEVLYNSAGVVRYLRENQFSSYAVKQHHYSVFPAGVIKTDFPTRIFRSGLDVKFFGVVHEHPETELNKGIGHASILNDIAIGHYGYDTEETRRGRFTRNIGLLMRDRKENPDRILGKFLWMRDLAQMCNHEMEHNGGQISEAMRERALEGIKCWEELLETKQIRMLVDGLDFYSALCRIRGEGFEMAFKLSTSKLNGGPDLGKAPEVKGFFCNYEHAEKFMKAVLKEKTSTYSSKYF